MKCKHIFALVALASVPIQANAIVYNADDADTIITNMMLIGGGAVYTNSANPFKDPFTFYVRSSIVISDGGGGGTATYRIRNEGNNLSPFNTSINLNNSFAPLFGDPEFSTNMRIVGGIGVGSKGTLPGVSGSQPGSWVKLVDVPATEASWVNGIPAGSATLVWAVNLGSSSVNGYIDGANYGDSGPRWPMSEPRAFGSAPQEGVDRHELNGKTQPFWTDQPIVCSLDFEYNGTYLRGQQIHFARSNDYYLGTLDSKATEPTPLPWHHLKKDSLNAVSNATVLYTEGDLPNISSTTTWHTDPTKPSDVRCELFDESDFANLNYGVRSVEVGGGQPMRVVLNANRKAGAPGDNEFDKRNARNRFRLVNAPQFLRHPGQMVFHSATGWLYFIPYIQPTSESRMQVLNVSLPYPYRSSLSSSTYDKVAEAPIFLRQLENFSMYGITFDTCFATGLKMQDTRGMQIQGCEFNNMGSSGVQSRNTEGWYYQSDFRPAYIAACWFQNTYKCAIDHYDARWEYHWGQGRLKHQAFACGTPSDLLYSNNYVGLVMPPTGIRPAWMTNTFTTTKGSTTRKEHMTLRSYGQIYPAAPAIDMRGDVRGALVEGNAFRAGGGVAIRYSATKSLIKSNLVDACVLDLTDTSGIYCGREAILQGNSLEENDLRHITRNYGDYVNNSELREEVAGIMFDDGVWGQAARRNQFWNVDLAFKLNGGRYNLFERNKFNKVNKRMIAATGAIGNDTTPGSFFEQAKRCCGTAPFNDLSDPDPISFTHSAWNWHRSSGSGAYNYQNTGWPLTNDLLNLDVAGESIPGTGWSTAINSSTLQKRTEWLDSYTSDGMQLIVWESNTIPGTRCMLGYRNLFVYGDSDFGTDVPSQELGLLTGFQAGQTNTPFEMGYNWIKENQYPASNVIPAYRLDKNSLTRTNYRKFLYGMKVTTP